MINFRLFVFIIRNMAVDVERATYDIEYCSLPSPLPHRGKTGRRFAALPILLSIFLDSHVHTKDMATQEVFTFLPSSFMFMFACCSSKCWYKVCFSRFRRLPVMSLCHKCESGITYALQMDVTNGVITAFKKIT